MVKRRMLLILGVCLLVAVFTVEAFSQTSGSSQQVTLPLLRHLENKGSQESLMGLGQISEPGHVKYDEKIAKLFKVDWLAINYNGQTLKGHLLLAQGKPNVKMSGGGMMTSDGQMLKSPELLAYGNRSVQMREGALLCEIGLLDPERVMGLCREAIVDELADGKGREVDVSLLQPYPDSMHYDKNRPQTRFETPSKIVRLEGQARARLNLPLKDRHRPHLVSEPRDHSSARVQLDVGMPEWVKEIGHLKGHFYVLMPDSFKYVDIPFKPSRQWVRLTPEIEVRVVSATTSGDQYRYKIEVRPEEKFSKEERSIEDVLPSQMVIKRHFLGNDERIERGRRSFGPDFRRMQIGGEAGGINRAGGEVTKIRYVIAVNPTHYKVPFEIENIPLPTSTGQRPTDAEIRDFKLSAVMTEELEKIGRRRLSKQEKEELKNKEEEIAGGFKPPMYALGVNREQWDIMRSKMLRIVRLRRQAYAAIGGWVHLGSETSDGVGNTESAPSQNWPRNWANKTPELTIEAEKLVDDIIALVDAPNADPIKIQEKMEALRRSRRHAAKQLPAAQEDLRKELNARQEAAMVFMGYLGAWDGLE